jgi:predicted DCC family thiol-disulfide oxidoreductase YuxK
MELTLFYDSACPLCRQEMGQLKRHDRLNRIHLVDINQPQIAEHYPYLDIIKANQLLHGLTADGRWIYGLDVTVLAWQLTGKHAWLKVLRLPLIKPFADAAYLLFARHRYRISYLITGKKRCDKDSCRLAL